MTEKSGVLLIKATDNLKIPLFSTKRKNVCAVKNYTKYFQVAGEEVVEYMADEKSGSPAIEDESRSVIIVKNCS